MTNRRAITGMLLAAGAFVTACATAPAPVPPALAPPRLLLAPAALPGGLALEQRLTFVSDGRRDTVDAMVEVDAAEVRVVVHAQGQVALRLAWDGETLTQTRDPRLPASVQAERVLDELQFAYWPPAAIAKALPAGWRLEGDAARRVLRHGDEASPTLEVTHHEDGGVRIVYPGQGWELQIASRPVAP